MKAITVRELNRRTAEILDAVEHGETFEVLRSGRVVGYMTQALPPAEQKPDWKAHFARLRRHPRPKGFSPIVELEAERRRQQAREDALE